MRGPSAAPTGSCRCRGRASACRGAPLVRAHLGDELARPAFQGPVAVDQAVHHVAARPFQVAEVVQGLVGDLELEEARVDQGVGVDGDEARAAGRAGGGLVAGVEAVDAVHPPGVRRLAPEVAPERVRPRLVVGEKDDRDVAGAHRRSHHSQTRVKSRSPYCSIDSAPIFSPSASSAGDIRPRSAASAADACSAWARNSTLSISRAASAAIR